MATVKVVILNWNGRSHLERFLPFVVATTPFDIVVADNGSTDDSVAFMRACYPDIQVVELDRNYGFAGGYNRALAQLEADYFVLMNSDVEPLDGWCEPLLELMESESDIAAVQPKILSLAEPEKFEYAGAAGGFIDWLGYPFCRGRILSSIEKDEGQYDDCRDVFWASGACMMVRARVFGELGGFDDDFFAHMEEIDLCWRMQSAGWRVAVEPRGVVRHLGGGTLSAGSERKIYLNFRNSLAMLYKNRGGVTIPLRMLLDGCSAAIYLLGGRADLSRAVLQAHKDFRRWRSRLKKAHTTPPVNTVYICKYPILLLYFLGRRKFGRML